MQFEAIFRQDGVKLATEKGSYISPLGSISCMIAEGKWEHLADVFSSTDTENLKSVALKILDRCFSSKDKKKKIEGYLLCDEEFKASKSRYSVTKSVESIDEDGTIQFIDTYYLTDFTDFILLEMMYSLTYNVPIVKCGSCSRFFIAENPTMHYCDNPACRQFAAKKRSKETKQADELLLLYDKVYQATYYRHKKCTDEKQKEQLDARLKQLMEYRMKYKKSEISVNEFEKVLHLI